MKIKKIDKDKEYNLQIVYLEGVLMGTGEIISKGIVLSPKKIDLNNVYIPDLNKEK